MYPHPAQFKKRKVMQLFFKKNLHFLFFIDSLIYMCIHCLGHFSPCTLLPPFTPLSLWHTGRICSCPLLQFCLREDINNNKKHIAFLLVWDKYSHTERFLALLPYTCVLQPELNHLSQTSSLLPGHLPILTSVIFRLLY
jgi:hypothetical protein